MTRSSYALAAVLLTGGLIATACGGSSDTKETVTVTASSSASSSPSASAASSSSSASSSASATASPSASASGDLPSLIPTPANSNRTDGPDTNKDNGIRMHFVVSGAPTDVMDAYKTALEGKGWAVEVQRSGGGGGGGGATYTGTNGSAFGVFVGGGYGGTTDVNACAWPSKPSNTHCG